MLETKSFAFKERKSSCLCPFFSHMLYFIFYLILFLYPVAQQYFTPVTISMTILKASNLTLKLIPKTEVVKNMLV